MKSSYEPVRRIVVSSVSDVIGMGRMAVTPALWCGSLRCVDGDVRGDMMSFESSPPE